MTIHGYYLTIEKWIHSCETTDQLAVCNEVIDKVFIDRFKATEDLKLINELVVDLTGAISLKAQFLLDDLDT